MAVKKSEKQALDELHRLFDNDELVVVEIDEAVERKKKRERANEYNRKRRAEWANKKLCRYCGEPARTGYGICQQCTDKTLKQRINRKKKENPNYEYVPLHATRVTYDEMKAGFRTCWGCKQKVHISKIYKKITKKNNPKFIYLVTCSEACWNKFITKQKAYVEKKYGKSYQEVMEDVREKKDAAKLCRIIREHDEALKDDPDKIDIKKYLRKHVECK